MVSTAEISFFVGEQIQIGKKVFPEGLYKKPKRKNILCYSILSKKEDTYMLGFILKSVKILPNRSLLCY